ncbi:MAG: lysylphosphatidylglycerol synthase transmembrane domain-containing protein [Ferrimicrobium sp.]
MGLWCAPYAGGIAYIGEWRTRIGGTTFRIGLGVVGLAIAVYVLWGQRSQFSGTVAALSRASIVLGLVALAFEVASNAAYASISVALFERGRRRRLWPWFFAVTVAAIAIANSVPLGTGFSSLYVYGRLRSRVFSIAHATAIILATNVIAIATLIGLLIGSLASSDSAGRQVLSVVDVVALIAVATIAVVAVLRVDWVARLAIRWITYVTRRIRGPKEVARGAAELALTRMGHMHFGYTEILEAAAAALGNWVFDLSALVVSLVQVHAHVGIVGVVSAYFLGALAANLPITPGGLGVVEGSVTVALVAFGGAPAPMLAAVLLYRLVSYWIWIPIGWLMYFLLGRRSRGLSPSS